MEIFKKMVYLFFHWNRNVSGYPKSPMANASVENIKNALFSKKICR
jgi:hypothetical protein